MNVFEFIDSSWNVVKYKLVIKSKIADLKKKHNFILLLSQKISVSDKLLTEKKLFLGVILKFTIPSFSLET